MLVRLAAARSQMTPDSGKYRRIVDRTRDRWKQPMQFDCLRLVTAGASVDQYSLRSLPAAALVVDQPVAGRSVAWAHQVSSPRIRRASLNRSAMPAGGMSTAGDILRRAARDGLPARIHRCIVCRV